LADVGWPVGDALAVLQTDGGTGEGAEKVAVASAAAVAREHCAM